MNCPKCGSDAEIAELRRRLEGAQQCIADLLRVTDEYAGEFVHKRSPVDWGFVNETFLTASRILKGGK